MIKIDFKSQELSDLILPLRGKIGNISSHIHFAFVNINAYNVCYTDDIKFFVGRVSVEVEGGSPAPSFTFNLHDVQQLLALNNSETLSIVYTDNCFYCYQGDNLIFMGDYDIPKSRFFPLQDVWSSLQESEKIELDRESFLSGIRHLKKASDSSFIFMFRNLLAIQEHDIQVYRRMEVDSGVSVCFHSDEVRILENFQTSADLYLKTTNQYLLFMDSELTRMIFVPNRKEPFISSSTPKLQDATHSYILDESEVLRLVRILSSFSEDSGSIQVVGDSKCLRARVKNDRFKRDSLLTLSNDVKSSGPERTYFFTLLSHMLRVLSAYADIPNVKFLMYSDRVMISSELGKAFVLNRNSGVWV